MQEKGHWHGLLDLGWQGAPVLVSVGSLGTLWGGCDSFSSILSLSSPEEGVFGGQGCGTAGNRLFK